MHAHTLLSHCLPPALSHSLSLSVQFEPFPEDDVVSAINEALRDTLSLMNASELTDTSSWYVPNDVCTSLAWCPGLSPPRQLPPGVTGIDGDSRAAFPLTLIHCPHYVQSRVALVG